MNELYLQDYILKQISRKYNHKHHSQHPSDEIRLLFGKVTKDFFHKNIPKIDNLFKFLIKEVYIYPDHSICPSIEELRGGLLRMNITKEANGTELNKKPSKKN